MDEIKDKGMRLHGPPLPQSFTSIDASVEGLSRVGAESSRIQSPSLSALILLGEAEEFRVPFFRYI